MAPKENLLRQILVSQTTLVTKMENLENRLFGGEGQDGSIPILFEKHDRLSKAVQGVKDEALAAVQKTKDVDIEKLRSDVYALKTNAALAAWKAGTIYSVGGGGAGVALTLIIKKLLGVH